jgi:hypothetical protein
MIKKIEVQFFSKTKRITVSSNTSKLFLTAQNNVSISGPMVEEKLRNKILTYILTYGRPNEVQPVTNHFIDSYFSYI